MARRDKALTDIDQITGDVLETAVILHRGLGPGLLESVYEVVLAAKLLEKGYSVDRQKPIDIECDGLRFDAAFRIDLLIDQRLLVEIKSVERLTAAHHKQLLTSPAHESASRPSAQFWRSYAQGGREADRQCAHPLRDFASPRESFRNAVFVT